MDTAGQEQYRAVTRNYYKNLDIAILVYDASSERSFASLTYLAEEINKHVDKTTYLVVVDSKCDLGRVISKEKKDSFISNNKSLC